MEGDKRNEQDVTDATPSGPSANFSFLLLLSNLYENKLSTNVFRTINFLCMSLDKIVRWLSSVLFVALLLHKFNKGCEEKKFLEGGSERISPERFIAVQVVVSKNCNFRIFWLKWQLFGR